MLWNRRDLIVYGVTKSSHKCTFSEVFETQITKFSLAKDCTHASNVFCPQQHQILRAQLFQLFNFLLDTQVKPNNDKRKHFSITRIPTCLCIGKNLFIKYEWSIHSGHTLQALSLIYLSSWMPEVEAYIFLCHCSNILTLTRWWLFILHTWCQGCHSFCFPVVSRFLGLFLFAGIFWN